MTRHMCVRLCVYVAVHACVCIRMRSMRSMHPIVRVRVGVRGGSGRLLVVCHCVYVCFCVCMLASMYVYMCVCTSACIDSLLSARVRECVRAHTGGSSARPLDVHPYVHECMCMHVYMDACTGA